MFFLFIGASDICKVPGLSAAGANPQVVPFTAPADADLVCWGRPRVVDVVPVDPQGHPTPALVTRAARLESGFPYLAVRSGSYLPPACPFLDLGALPGGDPQEGPAVPEARGIFEAARELGGNLASLPGPFVLGESVPGGTTTALLVLRALGRPGMVSSAGPENPVPAKEQVWERASFRGGISFGSLSSDPLEAVRQLGDPMQAAVAGFVAGLSRTCEVVLAGGTQMVAVAAVLRHLGEDRPLVVATTRYVDQDPSAHFREMARDLEVEAYAAPLDFSACPFPGLADYERGFVKEGVGAGGSVWYAQRLGVSPQRVCARTEELYRLMTQGA